MSTATPLGIYEDVEELKAQVAALQNQMSTVQNQITALFPVELPADTDLNTLDIGMYIIPTTAISGSLLNKPANANTATGYIKVIEGGNSAQKMMYYFPCVKDDTSYWQRAYYTDSWGSWVEMNVVDSGWIDLTLNSNVIAFNEEQKPRYRRVGKEVFITGVVKNISAFNTVIATLPVNYRPSKKIIIAVPSTATKFSRISISTAGVITYEQSSDDIVGTGNWHSIACSFVVD